MPAGPILLYVPGEVGPIEVLRQHDAEELAELVWANLNADNKVSLFIRGVPLDGGKATDIIINKNK